MKLRNLLLAATVLAVPVAAKAQPYNQPIVGLYVGAGAGYDYMTNTSISNFDVQGRQLGQNPQNPIIQNFVGNSHLRSDGGFAGLGSIGWGLGNGLRLEVEGSYRQQHTHLQNNINFAFANANINGGNSNIGIQGGGNVQNYGGMFNAVYDFNNLGWPVVPYVGLGVGYLWTELQSFNFHVAGFPGNAQVNSSSKGSFAAQGIVGVAYNIPGIYGLALTGEVRGLGVTQSLKYSVRAGSLPAGNGNSIIANSFKLGGQAHVTALVGLRYAFNAAPPPPPPPPAPAPVAAPARSYLVFFDWDRADLTARARQVIAEAAQNSTKIQYTRIEVNGYTDTSGTPAYNQRLSVRRAEAVAAELVRDGVPRNVMDLHGFGETHLLVQTGPGVREPQNRRVEIIYH